MSPSPRPSLVQNSEDMELNINQYHSIKDCLGSAYSAIKNNVKTIMRKTWWVVLIEALVMAVVCYFFLPNKPLHDWGEENEVASFVIQTIVYLAGIVMNIIMLASFWRLINEKKFTTNLCRTLVVTLSYIIIGILAFVVFKLLANWMTPTPTMAEEVPSPESIMTKLIFLTIGILMVFIIVVTPLTYSFARYMMEDRRLPWGKYGTGFKYWGTLFVTQMLVSIITSIILVLIALPLDILVGAQFLSQLGGLDGDPIDVPSYFTPLLLATLTIFFFVAAYFILWIHIVFAYQYGSIETQQREKKLPKA